MKAVSIFVAAVSVAAMPVTIAHACDNDRYPCEPKIAKPSPGTNARAAAPKFDPAQSAPRAERKAARTYQAPHAGEEKAPPDAMPYPAKLRSAAFWQPIDVPSQAVQPLADNTAPEARNPVRVVSADEVNEIDLAALSVPGPVKIVPIRVVWPDAPAPLRPAQVIATPPAPAPADTSLLERVMMTFGGAFGAASALRMFVG